MTLQEMIREIHFMIRSRCFIDLVEALNVSPSSIAQWRNKPPEKPSLHVFCALALHFGFDPKASQLHELL